MSSLAKALSAAILMGTAGQAAAVDNTAAITRALSAIRANPVATRLSTSDAFTARGVTVDRNGTEHVRLARTYKGLPVIGGDLVVHSSAGVFKSASLTQAKPLNVSTTPTISADHGDHERRRAVRHALRLRTDRPPRGVRPYRHAAPGLRRAVRR